MAGSAAAPNIFVYVPNLIGFARVVLGVASLFYMASSPILAMVLYWTSAFLDVFDGYFARLLDQCTIFGSVLDMVSDRCTTLCLIMVCAQFYPDYIIHFQLLIVLDIASHWLQMYSSLIQGKTSHKFFDLKENSVLRFYYTKPVLFTLCSANELFFMALYFNHFGIGFPVTIAGMTLDAWVWIGYISFPLFLLKHFVGLIQLVVAARNIALVDIEAITKRAAEKKE